jgi:hypothetical protein
VTDVATDTGVPITPTEAPNQAAPAKVRKVPPKGTPERKEYDAAKERKSRLKQKKHDQKTRDRYNSLVEINHKDAVEILTTELNVRNPHVADVLADLAEVAAVNNKFVFNEYLIRNGVQGQLLANAAKAQLDPIALDDVWLPGERIRQHELKMLWDFSTSWRKQPDGTSLSFERFKELRRMAMVDTFEFGRQILGLDFWPEPHGKWAKELFVTKNPDLLPENYTREDFKSAISAQSEIHSRILMASRSSYKSTYNLVDLLSWVLVLPDIRILVCSATEPLSNGFLKAFRAYWTVKNPTEPTLFNQLFPEWMLEAGKTAVTSFTCPMRRLDIIQPTFKSVSLGTEGVAGERCDLLVTEDAAENTNSSTPEMRVKTLEKFDLLRELLEPAPIGYLQMIGTPYSQGEGGDDPGDIYHAVLEREKRHAINSDEPRLISIIQPAWTVNAGVKKTAYDKTLQESEVTLLFPQRLTFKVLMAKLEDSEKTFRQQSLCSWVPDADAAMKIHFSEDDIRKHMRSAEFFQSWKKVQTILACDPGLSVTKFADRSAIVIADIMEWQSKYRFVIREIVAERWRNSELAMQIVSLVHKYHPTNCVVERTGQWEALQESIQKAAMMRSMVLPHIYFKPAVLAGSSQLGKASRVKNLQDPIARDLVWFQNGGYIDDMMNEFLKYDGSKSNTHRKDDIVDAISIGYMVYFPHHDVEVPAEFKKAMKEAREDAQRQAQYERYFGPLNEPYVPPATPDPTPRSNDPRSVYRIPGLRF